MLIMLFINYIRKSSRGTIARKYGRHSAQYYSFFGFEVFGIAVSSRKVPVFKWKLHVKLPDTVDKIFNIVAAVSVSTNEQVPCQHPLKGIACVVYDIRYVYQNHCRHHDMCASYVTPQLEVSYCQFD